MAQKRTAIAARDAVAALGMPADIVEAVPAHATLATMPAHPVQVGLGVLSEVPVDLVLLKLGLRPAALLHGPEPWNAQVAAWAAARGFTALPSPYAFVPQQDLALRQYSNLTGTRKPARGEPQEWRALAVSSSPRFATFVAWAEAQGWDLALGLALGYPPCCAKAFARDWPEAARHHCGDIGIMRLRQQGGQVEIMPALNIFARYDGPVLTDHFPCAWDCAASIARADRIAKGLAKTAPRLLAQMTKRAARHIRLTPDGPQTSVATGADKVRVFETSHERVA